VRPAVLFSWAAVLLDDVSEQGPRLLRFLLLAQRALQAILCVCRLPNFESDCRYKDVGNKKESPKSRGPPKRRFF